MERNRGEVSSYYLSIFNSKITAKLIFYRNNCSMLSQSNIASDQVSNCSKVAVSSLQMLAGDSGPNFLVSWRLTVIPHTNIMVKYYRKKSFITY
ncbi:hypothetical protein TI04_10515 [Achromatium sp. WMS2]|nr:hypothetical protein TI04_10515 [Achromatium sp. WMS2]